MSGRRAEGRPARDPTRPVYVISVAAELVRVHPRTLRIYEVEGLLCPARTPTNIRLYSENDIRRVLWIRHLTQNLGVNLAGVRILFELEERLGMRILETLYRDRHQDTDTEAGSAAEAEEERPRQTADGLRAAAPKERNG
ncbi:hypothetical protein BH24CHL6_BH24CHL6_11780 [soil metagenome]